MNSRKSSREILSGARYSRQSHLTDSDAQNQDNLLLGAAISIGFAALIDIWLAAAGLAATTILLLLRRVDHPPIILFCLGYQWLFIFAGIFYRSVYGLHPSDHQSSNLNQALLMLLVSVTVLSLGVRAGMDMVQSSHAWKGKWRRATRRNYSLNRLIVLVLLGALILWIPGLDPRQINFGFSQIIYRVIEFRTAFVFLLFVMAIRQRRGYLRVVIVAVVVTLPMLTSGGAGFSQTLILVFIAFVTEGRILQGTKFLWRHLFLGVGVVALAACLLALAVVWNGAMKPSWRETMREGEVVSSRVGRIQQFADMTRQEVSKMDWEEGTWATAKRVSDVPMMMAHVLSRVPGQVHHENGSLTLGAIQHVAMPRFLFPDKRNLGSDSDLVRNYAGLVVAGAESNTSIGLGYLIELYVDFGSLGMVLAAGVIGFLIGILYRAIYLVCPSQELYHGVLSAIMLQHFTSLEGSLAKIMGGLIMAFVVLGAIMYFFGSSLDRFLQGTQGRPSKRRVHRRSA